jgi:hypothetical protein
MVDRMEDLGFGERDQELKVSHFRFVSYDFQLAIGNGKLRIGRWTMFIVTRIVVLLTVAIIGVGCTGEKEATKGTVQGTVYVIGNEPFTSIAVEDSQGKMLRLSTSKEVQQQLLGLQGRKVEVHYSRIDTTAEGITLSVDKFKEISP